MSAIHSVCIFSLGLCFVCLFVLFDLFVSPFLFSWAVESSPLVFGASITNLNEPPRGPASVAQWAEAQCAPAGTVCRRGGVQSPGRPADFVFGFQGCML